MSKFNDLYKTIISEMNWNNYGGFNGMYTRPKSDLMTFKDSLPEELKNSIRKQMTPNERMYILHGPVRDSYPRDYNDPDYEQHLHEWDERRINRSFTSNQRRETVWLHNLIESPLFPAWYAEQKAAGTIPESIIARIEDAIQNPLPQVK